MCLHTILGPHQVSVDGDSALITFNERAVAERVLRLRLGKEMHGKPILIRWKEGYTPPAPAPAPAPAAAAAAAPTSAAAAAAAATTTNKNNNNNATTPRGGRLIE